MVEEPVGTWLCPTCSPNKAFYAKQLVQKREDSPLVPEAEKADEPAGSGVWQQEREREQVLTLGTREKEVAKKGVAVKRPAAPKPKPRWVGWVELSSEGEEDFKTRVDAQWSVDNVISGKRRRASKAVGEDTETGSRTLRRNSRRKRIIETDSDEEEGESVYQEKDQQQQQEEEGEEEEEEEEGAPVHRKASVIDMLSGDSDDSEYAMDVDAGADDADEDSADELSDPHSDSWEESILPDQIRADSTSHRDRKTQVSEPEPEDLEDSMDMEYQDKSLEASSSHASDVSEHVDANEYMDDNEVPGASRAHVNASPDREVAVSPVTQVSERARRREEEGHEVPELDPAPQAVESNNSAPLYQRQGNCWGDFPESAIRSTLPRLA